MFDELVIQISIMLEKKIEKQNKIVKHNKIDKRLYRKIERN